MKLTGEDLASAVREWIRQDLRNSPSFRHDLGKFLFTVSTGTLGLFATLLKFAVESPSLDLLTQGSFAALLLSTVVSLYMALPYLIDVTGNLELYSAYNRIVRSIVIWTVVWLALWTAGFVLGVVKLFK